MSSPIPDLTLPEEILLALGLQYWLIQSGVATNVEIGPIDDLDYDDGVAILPSVESEEIGTGNTIISLSCHIRGMRLQGQVEVWRTVKRLNDYIRPLRMTTINGVSITAAWLERPATLGLDDQMRFEVIYTYNFRTDRLGVM